MTQPTPKEDDMAAQFQNGPEHVSDDTATAGAEGSAAESWTLPAFTGGHEYAVTFLADGTAWRVLCKLGGTGRRGKQRGEGSGRLTWVRGTRMGLTATCAIRAAYNQAIRRVTALMNAEPGTPESAELDRLADFCVAYEEANFPWRKEATTPEPRS